MFRWLENFVQRRRFFEGGSAPSLMGAGDGAEICFYSFSYILTARRRINKLMMKLVENSVLVLVHAIP